MDERRFFEILGRESPSQFDRCAYSAWLLECGERAKASFVRHRAELMRLTSGTQLYRHHADAVKELLPKIDESWLSNFRTDLTPHEKLSLECDPLWTGATTIDADVPTLRIADGLSIYFEAPSIHQVITNSLLRRWGMPFEFIVSHTVTIWDDDLQNWTRFPFDGPGDLYRSQDCGDDGSWASWFYVRPETWLKLEEATDGEVVLNGAPVLMPVDSNQILLTSLNDPGGLRHMARAVSECLGEKPPIVRRPLRYDSGKNWEFLSDDDNAAAEVWLSCFGPSDHSPLQSRDLREPIEVVRDSEERKAAQQLIHRYPIRDRIEVLALSGQRGDWRLGEEQSANAIPEIKSLPHLQELRVWSAKLSPRWWDALAECALPSLVSLIIESSEYDGDSIDAIAYIPSIECLHLNRLGDKGLETIAKLPRLRELNIAGTATSDAGIESLAHGNIEFLNLSNCRLTDNAAAVFTTLTELSSLNLRGTTITDAAIEALVALPKLTYLDLRETNVTDEAVYSLSRIKTLKKVDGISGSAMLLLMDELPNFGTKAVR